MVGRFTARRATTSEPLPTEEPTALEGVSWTVFPETGGEQDAAAPQAEMATRTGRCHKATLDAAPLTLTPGNSFE